MSNKAAPSEMKMSSSSYWKGRWRDRKLLQNNSNDLPTEIVSNPRRRIFFTFAVRTSRPVRYFLSRSTESWLLRQ
jgi:hypothetical protein